MSNFQPYLQWNGMGQYQKRRFSVFITVAFQENIKTRLEDFLQPFLKGRQKTLHEYEDIGNRSILTNVCQITQ